MPKKQYKLKREPLRGSIPYEADLNPQQLEAVTASDGPALVIAGAGSGKTRVVTYRVAYLLDQGVKPDDILLLTFTKKAAEEMLRRVQELVQMDVGRIWGGTFHHVGNRVIRRHAELLGFQPNYTILDRDDSRVLIETVMREEGIDTKSRKFPRGNVLLEAIGYARNADIDLAEAVEFKCAHFLEILPRLESAFKAYQKKKLRLNYLDFDDLLVKFAELLEGHPEVAEIYRRRFRHIMVDEYQDTNLIQARIVDDLSSVHGNLMVVGDDSQSIYSFRGAEYRNIYEFPQRYPGCRVYTVETNYRSTPEILRLTNQVLAGAGAAFKKRLRAVRERGAAPALIRPFNVYEQAEFVAQRVLELQDEGADLSKVAVLYRSHYHSMELQMELTRRGIPFSVRSGLRFFEQAHIKDVLAYLKIIDNPMDEIAWKRVLVRLPRVGPRSAEKIWSHISASADPIREAAGAGVKKILLSGALPAWKNFIDTLKKMKKSVELGPAELIGLALESDYSDYLKSKFPNFKNRLDDLKQLAGYADRYKGLEAFLSELAMMGGVTTEEVYSRGEEEMITLSTVHQAKGLEWDVVFLIWLAEGKFPAAASYQDTASMEEERRLFYVATTRCRDELYLLYPLTSRQRSGMEVDLKPSRFLESIPPGCYEEWDLLDADF